jgi:hypothetical protein
MQQAEPEKSHYSQLPHVGVDGAVSTSSSATTFTATIATVASTATSSAAILEVARAAEYGRAAKRLAE